MNALFFGGYLYISGMLFALFSMSEVQLRLITINRPYNLKISPILFALFTIIFILLLTPVSSRAVPKVVNALEEDRGDWRDYYRNKFFADMHSNDLMISLTTFETKDPHIKEAIRQRIDGQWKESIDALSGLIADPAVSNQDEVAYILGLIYESLSFFPEAMGNYDRLEFKRGQARGDFYYKTILRKSYVKFITGLKYSRLLSMIDADGGFFKVFNDTTNDADWSDALAGHGVMLYFFGAHENAEEIFRKVKQYGELKPSMLFAQAENYMNMGLHQEARVIFQDLLHKFEHSERTDMLAYLFLRLGDIASIRGESDSALSFYKLITPKPEAVEVDEDGEEVEDTRKIEFTDPYIIQAMAVGEFYMKEEKNTEAIKVFNMLTTGPMPIGLDLRESIDLNLVLLHRNEVLELKAFALAKEFLLLYPENSYIEQVKRVVNDTIFKFIASVYESGNHNSVLYYYYENVRFINEKRTLMIVGRVFLELGFPEEANSVFSRLWNRNKVKDYSDIDLLTELARSDTMLGRLSEAFRLLSRARASAQRLVREKVALSWKLLGDEYYRKRDEKGALKSYGLFRATLFDVSIELRYAKLLASERRSKEAVTVYKKLLNRSITDETKAKAYFGAGETYAGERNWRKALINYQFALKLSERKILGEIHYKIAEVNYAMGRNKQAIKAWKEAMRVDEQGYYKRLAKGRIKEVTIWEQARM